MSHGGPARRQSWRLAPLCLFILSAGHVVFGQNVFKSDSFELDPLWSIFQQNGSVQTAVDVSHSGLFSLKLSSTSGGQREVRLTHVSPEATRGTLSVWFYDTVPGTQTLYAGLAAFNSADMSQYFQLNVADWNPSTYVWIGPGVPETATSVPRSLGWHEFRLQVTSTAFSAFIDQTLVGSVTGSFVFDTVRLFLSGPSFRPDAAFYFDDFNAVLEPRNPPGIAPAPVTFINVPATSSWVNGPTVTAGSRVIISATGQWTANPQRALHGPDGDVSGGPCNQPGCPIPSLTQGALVGRIGGGPPFFIGSFSSFLTPGTGVLQLVINDDLGILHDNLGAVDARITQGQGAFGSILRR
jgi:hypothetical protein